MPKAAETFMKFVEVVKKLRDPQGGCPWDLEQNHQTLRPYLVEETYEVLEAIDSGSDQEFKEELGDLLLQVVLHAQVANDRGAFDISAVTEAITDKMIRRHPHVFGTKELKTSAEVLKNWEQLKIAERKDSKPTPPSALDGIPKSLPALIRAQRLGEKASRVNFDWRKVADVWSKVQEEIGEFQTELNKIDTDIKTPFTTAPTDRNPDTQAALEAELGDVLFSLCQLARWLGISSEDALRGSISRFENRFRHMEQEEPELQTLTDNQLENAWERSKKKTTAE